MRSPDDVYLKVVSGQEVKLSPAGITVQCCGGVVKIEVLKNGKINLYAQEELLIATKGAIKMDAKQIIRIKGQETIEMKNAKGGSLQMDEEGNIMIYGTKVHMN